MFPCSEVPIHSKHLDTPLCGLTYLFLWACHSDQLDTMNTEMHATHSSIEQLLIVLVFTSLCCDFWSQWILLQRFSAQIWNENMSCAKKLDFGYVLGLGYGTEVNQAHSLDIHPPERLKHGSFACLVYFGPFFGNIVDPMRKTRLETERQPFWTHRCMYLRDEN